MAFASVTQFHVYLPWGQLHRLVDLRHYCGHYPHYNTLSCPQPPAPAAAGLADVVRGAVEPRAPALAAGPGLAPAGGEGRGAQPPGPRHPLGRSVVVNGSHQRIYEDTITNWLLNTRSRLLFSEYCCKISLCCDTFNLFML